jgi:hypothetical protein
MAVQRVKYTVGAAMPSRKTLLGKPYEYTGTLATGIVVNSATRISADIIRVIRSEITETSPVLMGASRAPLVADSVGETLNVKYRKSPQVMSYVLPLLIEEGFCTVSDRKPFVIHRR